MNSISPWGSIDWILPRVGAVDWTLVSGASFEDRGRAVPEWFSATNVVRNSFVIRVDDPPSRFTNIINEYADANLASIVSAFPGSVVHRGALEASPGRWISIAREVMNSSRSIAVDISVLPKRVWLLLVKVLLDSPDVCNLVVCYTRSASYPEGALTQDALPIDAFPGYGREEQAQKPTLVVGIGYVAFDVNELIQQADISKVKLVFPFPPASPAYRRNWQLVGQLMPDVKLPLEIKRMHAMDMFGALSWLKTVLAEADNMVDMVALGPKPHALAMGLACRRSNGRAQVLYSQPRIYRPDYSIGIGLNNDGSRASFAYALRKDGRDLFA